MMGENQYSLDSRTAFVIECMFCCAISKSEFRDWCSRIAAQVDHAPQYIYDLMSFDDELFKVFSVIGFVPTWDHTKPEAIAIYGIALHRGNHPCDMPVTDISAVNELKQQNKILADFKFEFPFISIPDA